MKIHCMMENTCEKKELGLNTESGLALLIEMKKNTVLFDFGLSNKIFDNAAKMKIDLNKIDTCIVSHGHLDHTGGLPKFLEMNENAKIYMKEECLQNYYFKVGPIKKSIGIPKLSEKILERITFLNNTQEVSKNIHIITDILKHQPISGSNKFLFKKNEGNLIRDDFQHEIIGVFEENDELVVITGCSHSGISNMIETVKKKFPNKKIKAVIGGFHLTVIPMIPNSLALTHKELHALGQELLSYKIPTIYTMHCTGKKAFDLLKPQMGDVLQYFATGESLEL